MVLHGHDEAEGHDAIGVGGAVPVGVDAGVTGEEAVEGRPDAGLAVTLEFDIPSTEDPFPPEISSRIPQHAPATVGTSPSAQRGGRLSHAA